MIKYLCIFLTLFIFSACKKTVSTPGTDTGQYYYPPLSGNSWETQSAPSLGWDEGELKSAFEFAGSKNTFGMIVLHHGKMVKEQYWNNRTRDTRHYLASAGKSVLAFVAGMALEDGIIHLDDKTSKYLGLGWTSLPVAKENLITLKHQLTMTTGLNEGVADPDCLDPACLSYKADAGSRWAYHNAPYRLLQNVLSVASGQTWQLYCKTRLFDKIGLNGIWVNHILFCTTREAARFGTLMLRKGEWEGNQLLKDPAYFTAMTHSSQKFNLGYGYLWWLNGQSGFMLPQSQLIFPGPLVTNAPQDMIMALGKDDQKIYVVPGLDVVVVRLGESAEASTAGISSFDNELWGRLKKAMKY